MNKLTLFLFFLYKVNYSQKIITQQILDRNILCEKIYHKEILKNEFINAFNYKQDKIDYFSNEHISYIKIYSLNNSFLKGKDSSLINGNNKIIEITYSNEEVANIAFKNLLEELRYVTNGELFFLIKPGAFFYLRKNKIFINSFNFSFNENIYLMTRSYLAKSKKTTKIIEINGDLRIIK
ncbi:hypothetical protein JJC04_03125 [Flavobacterium covae]|nr:hypothetical protein [Flavobacterium covae]QYS91724.1 hypothetical protein JJC04_03125 [Flavobacterium covae]